MFFTGKRFLIIKYFPDCIVRNVNLWLAELYHLKKNKKGPFGNFKMSHTVLILMDRSKINSSGDAIDFNLAFNILPSNIIIILIKEQIFKKLGKILDEEKVLNNNKLWLNIDFYGVTVKATRRTLINILIQICAPHWTQTKYIQPQRPHREVQNIFVHFMYE